MQISSSTHFKMSETNIQLFDCFATVAQEETKIGKGTLSKKTKPQTWLFAQLKGEGV